MTSEMAPPSFMALPAPLCGMLLLSASLSCPSFPSPLLSGGVNRCGARHRRMPKAALGQNRLLAAEGGDLRRLVAARQRIRLFRIDHLAQARLAIGDHAAIARILPEIADLVGIGIEIEQLRRHAD